jgi:hypothetical protein
VGLSLLDAKVSVSGIKQVMASRGAVQALGKLKPQQVEQFAEATRLEEAGKAAEADGLFQRLYKQIDEKVSQRLKEIRANRLMNPTDPNAGAIFPGNGKKLAGQRIAAMSEERALEVGQRLERIDGGHSLDRHGAQVTPEQLDKRLKTGVAPDGVVSFAPASTRFNSNKNWLQTRQQAVETLREKYGNLVGDDLRKPPGPNDERFINVRLKYDKPIDDGFIPDLTSQRRVTIPVDPVTNKPTAAASEARMKRGRVFDRTEPIEDVTGVFTKFAWSESEKRWKIVQHFPMADEWNNVNKTYNSDLNFDAEVKVIESIERKEHGN